MRILESNDLRANNISITGDNQDYDLENNSSCNEIDDAKNIARSGSNFTKG